MLEVAGAFHLALHEAFGLSPTACPACGAEPVAADEVEVVDVEDFDELAEIAAGEN
jgi:hypothetical protein